MEMDKGRDNGKCDGLPLDAINAINTAFSKLTATFTRG